MKKSRWLSSVVLLSSSLVCALSLRLYCDSDRSGKYDCNTCLLLANTLPNNDSSASSNSSVIAGVSLLQYPSRWHWRRNTLSCARSAAEQKPDYAWPALEINRLNFGADVTIAVSPLQKFKFLALLRSQSNQHLVVIPYVSSQLDECIAVVQ